MTMIDFSQPMRQSVKGLFLIFIQEGKKVIKTFWPVIVPVLLKKGSHDKLLVIGLILLGGIILTLIHAILYFRNYRFHIEEQQFILKKGYLNRKTLTIPLNRIQNVKTSQSVLQQFLDVMSLEIDTAGTASKELKIHALSKTLAVQLARELSSQLEIGNTTERITEDDSISREAQILRLSNRDLLKIGISQNHFRTIVILFLLGLQFVNNIEEYFEERAKEYSHDILQFLSESSWMFFGLLVLVFLLIAFLYSMIRTLVLFYDLKFLKMDQTYRIVSGLLNRRNLLVPFHKIQQMDWETGPLKKLFGIYRVNIRQATSDLTPTAQLIEIPGCLSKHIELMKNDLFGIDELKEQAVIHSSKVYFKRNWLFLGWMPAGIISPAFFFEWTYIIPAFSWIVLTGIFCHLKQRKSHFQMNKNQIRVSSGAISHKFKQMEFHKVQHLQFRQSIFHKKRGVASLKIGNASGFIRLPFINENTAKSLYDYLLYYAETSNKSWM
ncbi:MAG: PH domain-containing protein [Bacteroidota bacterium]|nr:PH domain-containing protein [Bacteroidota bacterium]